MKLQSCDRCGSKELTDEGGFLVCVYCRSKFVPEASQSLSSTSDIGVASDIDELLRRCREDPHNRQRYASLVLDLDPTNAEARRYL